MLICWCITWPVGFKWLKENGWLRKIRLNPQTRNAPTFSLRISAFYSVNLLAFTVLCGTLRVCVHVCVCVCLWLCVIPWPIHNLCRLVKAHVHSHGFPFKSLLYSAPSKKRSCIDKATLKLALITVWYNVGTPVKLTTLCYENLWPTPSVNWTVNYFEKECRHTVTEALYFRVPEGCKVLYKFVIS